jgi:DNA-binding NarL/FixJ family response regulator
MQQIRIVIADDHAVVRAGLMALLHQHAGFRVVGEAATGAEAIQQAALHKPDIVLMDIRMPGISGVDACRTITAQFPATRVVLLTAYAEEDILFAAIRAGAAGYVLKRIGSVDLIHTLQAVANGESELDPVATEALFKRMNELDKEQERPGLSDVSMQELRVLALIMDGATNREIAEHLFLGEGTVRNYVSTLLSKLHLANRAEAAAFAVHHKVKDYVTLG